MNAHQRRVIYRRACRLIEKNLRAQCRHLGIDEEKWGTAALSFSGPQMQWAVRARIRCRPNKGPR